MSKFLPWQDADGDGWTNLEEYLKKTDRTSATIRCPRSIPTQPSDRPPFGFACAGRSGGFQCRGRALLPLRLEGGGPDRDRGTQFLQRAHQGLAYRWKSSPPDWIGVFEMVSPPASGSSGSRKNPRTLLAAGLTSEGI